MYSLSSVIITPTQRFDIPNLYAKDLSVVGAFSVFSVLNVAFIVLAKDFFFSFPAKFFPYSMFFITF